MIEGTPPASLRFHRREPDAGLLAERFETSTAIGVVAALTAASGALVAVRKPESLKRPY